MKAYFSLKSGGHNIESDLILLLLSKSVISYYGRTGTGANNDVLRRAFGGGKSDVYSWPKFWWDGLNGERSGYSSASWKVSRYYWFIKSISLLSPGELLWPLLYLLSMLLWLLYSFPEIIYSCPPRIDDERLLDLRFFIFLLFFQNLQ